MSKTFYRWLCGIMLVALSGCYPDGADYVEELDLVVTDYNKNFDFASKNTFAMPDSVIKITGDNFEDPDNDGKPQFVISDYSKAILDKLAANMVAAGWTRVDKYANPDVILLASTMTTTNIYYWYDWGYWGWWYPYWDPWWGWYYPGYYPPYVTGYRSGSVFVQMVDAKPIPGQGENIPVVWFSILNGLAEGGESNITTRIQKGLDQAFAQSPYLKN